MWGRRKRSSAGKVGDNPSKITKIAKDPITHIEQYLSYYVSRTCPGYAVLVTGGWGSGKTYQIRHALPEGYAYYVSLFGLASPEEIEAQIFANMYPGKAATRKFTEKVDQVKLGIPILGNLGTGGLSSVLMSIFVKNSVDISKPLIFDDLERSAIDMRILLGLINRYVEHHGCRVIVIAHDAKIVTDFVETKEKIFGQTLVVKPCVEAAFQAFVAEFADDGKYLQIVELNVEILKIFRESGADSLRVLRHVVEDVGRLTASLDVRHLDNHAAMVELIRLFSALSIEARLGNLSHSSILKRVELIQKHKYGFVTQQEGPLPQIVSINEKYTSIDIGSSIMQDDVLAEIIFEGRFVKDNIQNSINLSSYFITEKETPPWQIVGSFDDVDDDIVSMALQRMECQFDRRELFESGELLHVVALKMMMAFHGIGEDTIGDVRDAANLYINDILARNELPERAAGARWYDNFKDGYAGVRYWVHDEYRDEFSQVLRHLIGAREKALERRFPELVPPLLDVVSTNGQKFFEMVCYTRDGKIEYEDVPILAHVPVKDFVDAWLTSPKTGWYWIGNALNERRKAIPNNPSLEPEADWYANVRDEMLARSRAVSGLAQLRIVRAAGYIGLRPPPG